MVELRIKIPLPEDPAKRALVIAIAGSILLHLGLLAWLIIMNPRGTPAYVKRGEPLLVDMAPDKPEERAPLGNPSRPPGAPAEPAPKAPEAPAPRIAAAPPAPKAVPAPKPPAPPKAPPAQRAAPPPPPAPEPPKQVAKAEPPQPAPKAPPEPSAPSQDALSKPPAPPALKSPDAPAPPPPPVAPPAQAEAPRALAAPPAVPPGPGGERVGGQTQTALAKPPGSPPPSIFRQPGAGGGGLRGGRGGAEGDPIPLDTPEPKYQDYFKKIREKIQAKWIYPREAGDRGLQGELLLEFHIAKDGRLAFIELRNSSGARILDDYAMRAVELAQPFPPVPDDIAKRVLAINGLFKYQIVGASLLNQYLR
jgi:TonB family protein